MEGAIPSDLWCLSSLESLDVSKNHRCYFPIYIIIPGSSGIPKWMSDKSIGCEVRIELP